MGNIRQQHDESATCYCDSGLAFSSCCHPLLEGHLPAQTAKALMRSRYTAFALGYSNYILKTWALDTRPKTLDLGKNQPQWLGMEILAARGGAEHDHEGEVEFTASYINAEYVHTMREKSRFVRSEQSWYYVDGTCQFSRKKIDRNMACPCQSGKKFKRCCCDSR